MRLLLTSNGLCNESIVRALTDMVGKPLTESCLCFIPTAANLEVEDKSWLINDLANCKKQGFASIDIVDIASVPRDSWMPRFETADVLLFGGGRTNYLHEWMQKSGVAEVLPSLLRDRVYVGISAGSKVTGPPLPSDIATEIGSDWEGGSLNYIPFSIIPHMNSATFPDRGRNHLERLGKDSTTAIYALDDQSAVQITDGTTSVVSEGEWLLAGKPIVVGS